MLGGRRSDGVFETPALPFFLQTPTFPNDVARPVALTGGRASHRSTVGCSILIGLGAGDEVIPMQCRMRKRFILRGVPTPTVSVGSSIRTILIPVCLDRITVCVYTPFALGVR